MSARQLADLARDAEALAQRARLAAASTEQYLDVPASIDPPENAWAVARDHLRHRRLRDQAFADGLFADPAWDILLDLFLASENGKRVSVSSACIGACVPPTTALRWIRHLVNIGLLSRVSDEVDGRRIFLKLTSEADAAMQRWAMGVRDRSRATIK